MPNTILPKGSSETTWFITFWASLKPYCITVFKDPGAFVSLLALLFNILLTYLNTSWFNKRRINDRKYNLEFTFYELLVIKNSTLLVEFSSEIKKLLNSLVIEVKKAIQAQQSSRKVVEEYIDKLDSLRDKVQLNILPQIKGYSSKLGIEIENLTEDFYDHSTDIFSKFDRLRIPSDFEKRSGNDFSSVTARYIDFLFKRIKKHCPNC